MIVSNSEQAFLQARFDESFAVSQRYLFFETKDSAGAVIRNIPFKDSPFQIDSIAHIDHHWGDKNAYLILRQHLRVEQGRRVSLGQKQTEIESQAGVCLRQTTSRVFVKTKGCGFSSTAVARPSELNGGLCLDFRTGLGLLPPCSL